MEMHTIAITTSASDASFSISERSENEPTTPLTPSAFNCSALSGERTRAVILSEAASERVRKRRRTVPPMYPERGPLCSSAECYGYHEHTGYADHENVSFLSHFSIVVGCKVEAM